MRVDNRLPLEDIKIIVLRHTDIRENLEVRPPPDDRSGVRTGVFFLFEAGLGACAVFALFKMQLIGIAVAANRDVHVFGGILCGTGAQTVQAERKLIVFAVICLVFAACIQLTEYQLPVVALFIGIKIHRNAAPVILHLNGMIGISGDDDFAAVALARLIDGIG